MNRPPLDKHVRRLADLVAPVLHTAARDPKTRQTAYEAASKLTGRNGREAIARLGEFSQPATQWLDTVRRSERRRRIRTMGSRLGLLAAAAGLLASWLLKRPNRPYGNDVPGQSSAEQRSSTPSAAATPSP
jgi:hypothetical protein